MRLPEISKIIQVPDGVEVTMEARKVTVKGEKGTLTRDFSMFRYRLMLTVRLFVFGLSGLVRKKPLS